VLFRSERVAQVAYRQKPWRWMLARPELEHRLFCYKEPFIAFGIEEMCGHFAQSKAIHIIRDGRDNADSMMRSYPDALSDSILADSALCMRKNSEIGVARAFERWFIPWWIPVGQEQAFLNASQFGRYVWMWREMVSRIQACGERLGPRRYLELRYESVVSDPEGNAAKIMSFIDSEVSPKLRRKLRRGRTNSIGISRRNQSIERLSEADAIAGDLLERLGYEPAGS
jgi:Sulfotransferase family